MRSVLFAAALLATSGAAFADEKQQPVMDPKIIISESAKAEPVSQEFLGAIMLTMVFLAAVAN